VRLVTPYAGLSLRFLMTEGSHFEALGQGKADFAFRLAGPVEAGIVYRELKVDPFVVVWDRKTPSPVGDLDAFCARPHILATPEGGEFGQLDERLREAGRSRRIAARTQNIFSAVRLVANSPMIAVAPRSVALEIARAHDLEMAEPPLDLPPSRISLAWSRAHDADPASAWLREGLFASLRSLLPLAGEGVTATPSPP
jgi:LysR family transcriptional activator of mexEF-oprN operon